MILPSFETTSLESMCGEKVATRGVSRQIVSVYHLFIYYVIYVVIIYLFIYLSIYLWKLTTHNLTKWSAIHDVLTIMTVETVQM